MNQKIRSRNSRELALITLSLFTAFICGIIFAEYKIFPYSRLKALTQKILPGSAPQTSYFGRSSDSSGFSNYYLDKRSFFEQHGQTYDIVMIGDSITDGAEWEDLFPSLKIANRGIYGDTTAGVLARLESIRATKAQKAFIMIGINDFSQGMPVSDVFNNYQNIVEQLKKHGMDVYIQSTLLGGERKQEANEKVILLNQALKELATEKDGITYIDLNQALAQTGKLNTQFSRDEVHLNGAGYAVWQDIIHPYIQPN